MVLFNKFFTSVYLAVVYASVASAAPWSPSSKYATHSIREVGKRGVKVVSFNPPSDFETFGAGIDHPNSESFAPSTLKESTVAFIQDRLKVDSAAINYRNGYTAGSTSYAYAQQAHEGIAFTNSVANVAFQDKKVVSFGNSFVKPSKIADSKPTIDVKDAIATAEKALDGKHNSIEPKIEYLVLEDGSAVLAHVIQVENKEAQTFYQAHVDAHSGELKSVVDFVNQASYLVLPVTKEYPTDGFENLTDPQLDASSPQGWHNDGSSTSTDTSGNNVVSYKGDESATTKQSGDDLTFNYPYDYDSDPTTDSNIDAARTNAFYLVNTIHDTWYQYGFDEASYNFQNSNFDKGGEGNDRVLVSVQDDSGTNNANFATPPDGQSGQMRMFLWTLTTPERDGAIENDIVSHEYTHGLSNRLTGGGTGSCLQTTESGGMGEGWSDAMAEWLEQTSDAINDYQMGVWVTGKNIRNYPYSTNADTNPLRYSSVASNNEVHNIGEIWANMLHNVYAGLIGDHGFDAKAKTDATSTAGNAVFLHLFIDALKLQPCNPTFVTARAAWIQADENRYGGANKCTLWKAFASRGLGVNAVSGKYTDDTSVPDGC